MDSILSGERLSHLDGPSSRAICDLEGKLQTLVEVLAALLVSKANSLYLLDEGSGLLVAVAQVGLPPDFVEAVARISLSQESGAHGRAVSLKSVIIVEDTRCDPSWSRFLPASEAAGLRAVWFVPIIADSGKVLGSFAIYYAEPRRPAWRDIELAQLYARHAAVVIEGLQRAGREQSFLKAVIDQLPEGVIIARSIDELPLFVNRAAVEILGSVPQGMTSLRDLGSHCELRSPDGARVPESDWPISRALKGEHGRNEEFLFEGVDGQLRNLLINYGPLTGADGSVWGGIVLLREVTEQKRAQHKLRWLEDIFSKAFNLSPSSISIATLKEGRYIAVNESFLQDTGYSREEVIGRTLFELNLLASDEDREAFLSALRSREKIRNLEIKFRTKYNQIVTALISAEVIEIEGQKCLLAVTTNVTDRKRIEEALRRSEARYRELVEFASDIIYRTDGNGYFTYANPVAARITEYSGEELIGKSYLELVRPDWRDQVRDFYVKQFKDRIKATYHELPIVSRGGKEVWIGQNVQLLVEGDQVIGFQAVARDITERKLAEAELARARHESEKERLRLRAIIEQMGEGLLILDSDGNVVSANQRAQEIFGVRFSQGNLLSYYGRFSNMNGDPIQPNEFPARLALERRSQVENFKLRYARPDGKKLSLSINAAPFFDEGGRLAGAISLIRDITVEQKESELAQQAEKLRALGQLSFGVAHNFNNALAAIIGYTQLALRKATEPEVRQFLAVIEQSARDAARMVERIQNFSRSRARAVDFVPVKLVDILRDAVEFTRPRWRHDAESLGIKYDLLIEWRAPEDLLVNGEPSELREVFVNIILNALDAMPTGGSLQILVALDGQQVGVSFTDTGIGMTEEIRRRAFEPFFTTKGACGLGMGLSESYRIIERHGGKIDIESQPHHGSTFTITLPVITGSEPILEAERQARPVPRKRILVVDDEKLVAEALSAMLAERGHEVVTTVSAEAGLRLVRESIFDIVFADLAMPKIDGMALAAEVKRLRPEVKVVLMSGYGLEKLQERAAESKVIDALVTKPFYFAQIESLLESLD